MLLPYLRDCDEHDWSSSDEFGFGTLHLVEVDLNVQRFGWYDCAKYKSQRLEHLQGDNLTHISGPCGLNFP